MVHKDQRDHVCNQCGRAWVFPMCSLNWNSTVLPTTEYGIVACCYAGIKNRESQVQIGKNLWHKKYNVQNFLKCGSPHHLHLKEGTFVFESCPLLIFCEMDIFSSTLQLFNEDFEGTSHGNSLVLEKFSVFSVWSCLLHHSCMFAYILFW